MADVIGPWIVVGGGRCGLQLARSMEAAGLEVKAVASRSSANRRRIARAGLRPASSNRVLPSSTHVLMALPDDVLRTAGCSGLCFGAPPRVILHTSGVHPGAVLAPGAPEGARLGSLHPMVSFPTASGALVPLAGRKAAIEGEPGAVRAARALAGSLGMRPWTLPGPAKHLYHAAAVVAANLVPALVVEARALLVRTGLPSREAAEMVRDLVRDAVDNVLAGPEWAHVTGPLTRGDRHTILAHRRALPDDVRPAYEAVSRLTLERLRHCGILNAEQVEQLRDALTATS